MELSTWAVAHTDTDNDIYVDEEEQNNENRVDQTSDTQLVNASDEGLGFPKIYVVGRQNNCFQSTIYFVMISN
jgi:hypothetical protein